LLFSLRDRSFFFNISRPLLAITISCPLTVASHLT
jgi:hypothetical protein